MIKTLHLNDFVRMFGASPDDFDDECKQFIDKTDFNYKKLTPKNRDKTILEIIKRIDSDGFALAGREGKGRWEKGWSENLDNFINKGYDLSELIPKYVRPNQICRLYCDYIVTLDPNFELNYFTILRLWLFKKYLKDAGSIYEFGCGTGYNLPIMAKLFPEKELYGLDWSTAAVDIVNLIGQKHKMKIRGYLFDMFSPDLNLQIFKDSVVLTIGSLEQLGENHQQFTDFLLKKSPSLCIHVEPICELYDENNLIDYLAIKYHKTRNYLNGYLTYLEKLRNDNAIQMIKIQRVLFGSLFHDGWSLVIWKPKI